MPIPPALIKFITRLIYTQINRVVFSKLSDPHFHEKVKKNAHIVRTAFNERSPLWLKGLHYKAKLRWMDMKERYKRPSLNQSQNEIQHKESIDHNQHHQHISAQQHSTLSTKKIQDEMMKVTKGTFGHYVKKAVGQAIKTVLFRGKLK